MSRWFRPLLSGQHPGVFDGRFALLRRHFGQVCLDIQRAAWLAGRIGVGVRVQGDGFGNLSSRPPLRLGRDDDGFRGELAQVIFADRGPVDRDGRFRLGRCAAIELRPDFVFRGVHVRVFRYGVTDIDHIGHDRNGRRIGQRELK